MSIERQNIQMRLAFPEGDWGEAPRASGAGTEVLVAMCTPESSAADEWLMEEVGERENLKGALRRAQESH